MLIQFLLFLGHVFIDVVVVRNCIHDVIVMNFKLWSNDSNFAASLWAWLNVVGLWTFVSSSVRRVVSLLIEALTMPLLWRRVEIDVRAGSSVSLILSDSKFVLIKCLRPTGGKFDRWEGCCSSNDTPNQSTADTSTTYPARRTRKYMLSLSWN